MIRGEQRNGGGGNLGTYINKRALSSLLQSHEAMYEKTLNTPFSFASQANLARAGQESASVLQA
jgi:hypothetical protein